MRLFHRFWKPLRLLLCRSVFWSNSICAACTNKSSFRLAKCLMNHHICLPPKQRMPWSFLSPSSMAKISSLSFLPIFSLRSSAIRRPASCQHVPMSERSSQDSAFSIVLSHFSVRWMSFVALHTAVIDASCHLGRPATSGWVPNLGSLFNSICFISRFFFFLEDLFFFFLRRSEDPELEVESDSPVSDELSSAFGLDLRTSSVFSGGLSFAVVEAALCFDEVLGS